MLKVTKYYRLDENNNSVECDRATWESNIESLDRQVERTEVGRYRISTAFTGISPIFETLIFDSWSKEPTVTYAKYSTWEAAKAGHQKAIEYVGKELVPF